MPFARPHLSYALSLPKTCLNIYSTNIYRFRIYCCWSTIVIRNCWRCLLFITMPPFEEHRMTAIAANGRTYWRELMGDFPALPWYLFAYEQQVGDAKADQIFMAAWEERLVDFIEKIPDANRKAVYRVDTVPSGLTFRVVSALWRPSRQGKGEGLLALLALEGEMQSVPLDSFLAPVDPELVGDLVYRAN